MDHRPFPASHLPPRLSELRLPPLWIAGELAFGAPTLAIVGTREPVAAAAAFAYELAGAVADAGGVVVSGGALGIDAAAHRGALARGGRTWVVAGTAPTGLYPPEHAELYEEVAREGGAMIWPFAPDTPTLLSNFVARNRVLVALADAVVIAQASVPSGALNAAMWARRLKRPLFVVAAPPWETGFEGCWSELDRGARAVTTIERLLVEVGLGETPKHRKRQMRLPVAPPRPLSADESALLAVLSTTPLHADEIAAKSHLAAHATTTALLTLALEDVVVEGPPGFFRRAN